MDHILLKMEEDKLITGPEVMKQVNVMHAITWAAQAWGEVKESTIKKCFARTGFSCCQSSADYQGEDQVVQHIAAVESRLSKSSINKNMV